MKAIDYNGKPVEMEPCSKCGNDGGMHIQRVQETLRRDGVIVTATCSLCGEPLKQKNPPVTS